MKGLFCALLALSLCGAPVMAQPAPAGELAGVELLHEVVWHLYRWYLDEQDAGKLAGKNDVVFWVRELNPKLDPGDKSLFGEILIPDLDVDVTVKKADYSIPELNETVRNGRFKIVNVSRPCPKEKPAGYTDVVVNYRDLKDFAHKTRSLARFPKEEIVRHFQAAAGAAIKNYLTDAEKGKPGDKSAALDSFKKQEQVLYLAPLLEVANETWAFWEAGRLLVRFSSDSDLENTSVWEHGEPVVKVYNIKEQTVVSLDEVPGSNAYMTRDQVGRIIFNCIVLGQRLPLRLAARGDSGARGK